MPGDTVDQRKPFAISWRIKTARHDESLGHVVCDALGQLSRRSSERRHVVNQQHPETNIIEFGQPNEAPLRRSSRRCRDPSGISPLRHGLPTPLGKQSLDHCSGGSPARSGMRGCEDPATATSPSPVASRGLHCAKFSIYIYLKQHSHISRLDLGSIDPERILNGRTGFLPKIIPISASQSARTC
jgi:hypothetical protein